MSSKSSSVIVPQGGICWYGKYPFSPKNELEDRPPYCNFTRMPRTSTPLAQALLTSCAPTHRIAHPHALHVLHRKQWTNNTIGAWHFNCPLYKPHLHKPTKQVVQHASCRPSNAFWRLSYQVPTRYILSQRKYALELLPLLEILVQSLLIHLEFNYKMRKDCNNPIS